MYAKNYRPPDPKREGACSKDVWRIYNMLPYYTNFTLIGNVAIVRVILDTPAASTGREVCV